MSRPTRIHAERGNDEAWQTGRSPDVLFEIDAKEDS
jgi:hypothetical protein